MQDALPPSGDGGQRDRHVHWRQETQSLTVAGMNMGGMCICGGQLAGGGRRFEFKKGVGVG